MKINSIFAGLEGEGSHIGIPQVFVRFQGCSVNCKSCDTPEAKNPECGKEMVIDDIIKEIEFFDINRVSFTGGNPLEQNLNDFLELIVKLKNKNYYISIEATGTEKIGCTSQITKIFNKIDFISFDIKTPSAKTDIKPNIIESMRWSFKSHYKMVIADWKDYKFAKDICKKYRNKDVKLILTPCWNIDKDIDKKFVRKIWRNVIKDKLKCRVILQQHKVLYGHKRGV